MEKRNRNVMILSIVALVLVLVGVTYAYFSAQITGIESASTISLTAGRMSIVYTEGDENVTVSNIYPKEEAWVTKTFTLTAYNTTNEEMKYDIGLNVETNGFANNYLTYDLKVLENTKGVPVSEKSNIPINGTGKIKFGTGSFTNADGDKHTYELKIYFKDNGLDQNDAQGAVFNAKLYVSEYEPKRINIALNSTNSEEVQVVTSYDINKENCLSFVTNNGMTSEQAEIYCTGGTVTMLTFDGEVPESIESNLNDSVIKEELISNGVVENVEYATEVRPLDNTKYVDGQYTYTYNELFDFWSVELTDKNSTDPVTTELASSINNKPIVSMYNMFQGSNATLIDLSSFDTSNVINMNCMFCNSHAANLDLSNFDLTGKNIEYILSSKNIKTVKVKDENNMNLICNSGKYGGDLQFEINGVIVAKPDNCKYLQTSGGLM